MRNLEQLQTGGVRVLVGCGWVWTLAIGALALSVQPRSALLVMMVAVANTIVPTLLAFRRRPGTAARAATALSYVVYPAILVTVLRGGVWQMDAHLIFLASLAALSVMYDWRALVLAAIVIALHHLVAFALIPGWVFDGPVGLPRLAFHAGAVVVQTGFLAVLLYRAQTTFLALSSASDASDAISEAANQARMAAEIALTETMASERRTAAERKRREAAERNAEADRRAQLLRIANDFEAGVAEVVGAVNAAARQLAGSAIELQAVARDTDQRVNGVASAATEASSAAAEVAGSAELLAVAIADVVGRTIEQRARGEALHATAMTGRDAVHDLTTRAASIGHYAQAIDDLSDKINLVAINATIEAARVGDVGSGFAVVAGEVKALAGRAGSATREIEGLTATIFDSATCAEALLQSVGVALDDVLVAGTFMRQAAGEHHQSSTKVSRGAHAVSARADEVARDIGQVVALADATRLWSDRVELSATGLATNAGNLQESTRRFVAALRNGVETSTTSGGGPVQRRSVAI